MTGRSQTGPPLAALFRILAFVALLVACRGSSAPQQAERPPERPARRLEVPPPAQDQPSGALKPVLRGLLDREGVPPPQYVGVAVGGFVVKAYWRDLQPSPGGPIADDNAIDRAVAEARRLNAQDPGRSLGVKLRVYGGVHAPDWAKSIGGPPIEVTHPESGEKGTVGRFWEPAYGSAYEDLENQLAAKYDEVPEAREVVISRCTTFFAEPFIRQKRDRSTVQNLLAGGFTTEADHRCHREQIDAHRVWQRTRSDLELNPYQDIEKPGRAGNDETFTDEMMLYCRASLGARCVLENNSVRVPPRYPSMYQRMRELGPPIAFQTASAAKVGDLRKALEWTVEQGAHSVELPGSYRTISPQELAPIHRTLQQTRG